MSDQPTTIDLDNLERLARVASPGPWEATELVVHPSFNAPNQPRVRTDAGREVARMAVGGTDEPVVAATFCTVGKYEYEKRNAAFIAAANPAVVLELVRRLRAAEVMSRDHDDARALIDPAKAVVDALRMYVRLDAKGLDPNMSSVLEKLDKYERAEQRRPPLSRRNRVL